MNLDEINVLVFLFGLMIGSFLNVCVYRIPKGESIVRPGSHCTQCDHQLAAWENIPIFSFLILGGKCRICKQKISWRYPMVELVTGFLFVLAFYYNGLSLELLINLVFISVIVVITFIDMDTFRIPNGLLVIGLVSGAAAIALSENFQYLFGSLTLLLLFLIIRGMGKVLFRKEAMGLGDVKFAAVIGLFLGWKIGLVAVFISFLAAALFSLVLLPFGKLSFGQRVPFGPFLSLGALTGLFWGSQILDGYISYIIK